MPSEKIRVPFPIKGLDSSTQLDAQAPGTTRNARNVRGICPRTGRNRGAQRAPLEKYTTDDGPGYRTQALAVVSYDQARNKYTQLNNEPNVDVSPTDVINGFEWGKSPVEGALYSVVTDLNGNVYTLSANRMIYKHSSDGELLDTLSIVGYSTEEIVRRIQVDALGNVYAATSTTDNSTLYRFEPDEDVGYITRYRWKSSDKMIDFQLKFGQIYHVSEKSSGTYTAYVAILYNLDSDIGPYTIFEKPVPSPVGGVAVGEDGSIYVTSPKNAGRNTTPDSGDFGAGVISWTPHELGANSTTNATTWEAHKRIHAWFDGYSLSGLDGSDVTTWIDRKQEGTQHLSSQTSATSPFLAVADSTDRSPTCLDRQVRYHLYYGYQPYSRKPPTLYISGNGLEAGGFGGKPCLRFNGNDSYEIQPGEQATGGWQGVDGFWWEVGTMIRTGQGLYWGADISSENRDTELSTNPNSTGLVPGIEGVPYTTFYVIRIDVEASGKPRGFFGLHNVRGLEVDNMLAYRLLVNFGHDDTDTVNTEGPPWSADDSGSIFLTGNISRHDGAANTVDTSIYWGIKDATYPRIGGTIAEGDPDYESELVFPEPWKASNANQTEGVPTNTLIIAVHHGGAGEIKKSCYRVNGAQVGAPFTFKGEVLPPYGWWVDRLSQVLGAACVVWDPQGLLAEDIQDDWLLYGGASTNSVIPGQFSGQPGGNSSEDGNSEDIHGFSGWIAEVITVLGETGVAPNDTVPEDHIIIDDGTGTGNSQSQEEPTEVEKIEGYLAWKWGLEATLDPSHPYNLVNGGAPPHTTLDDGSAETDPGQVFSDDQAALRSLDPILVKYNGNNGDLVWAMSAAGMGLSVVADDKNQVITFGQTVDPGTSEDPNENAENPTTGILEPNATMRKIIDLGETFVADDVGDRKAWTINNDTIPENAYAYPQMFLDKSGDVYVPSDPDQEKMLGGGGVYKVNVSDGSVDFHIPSPVNYFMEGADQSASGVSTGIGARDITKLPWSPSGSSEPGGLITRQYIQKFPNIAKHPTTGDVTVSGVRDTPSPFPNTTYHGDADADGNFDYILPKYRNILYCSRVEPGDPGDPAGQAIVAHENVQQVDFCMERYTLSEGGLAGLVHGWNEVCDAGSGSRDTATKHAPDLTPPYGQSGALGGASKLSVDGENYHLRMDLGGGGTHGGTNRIIDGREYTFSIWIARDPEVSNVSGTRTHDFARIRILQFKNVPGANRSANIVYNFSDGTVVGTVAYDGGTSGSTVGYGVQTMTAAKELGSTDTQIWDRVYVTLPYDIDYSEGNFVMQVWPVCGEYGAITQPTDRGAMHVWGPMLIEGTIPVSHNHPGWGSLGPTTQGNPSWTANVWLDGLTAEERASDGGAAIADAYPNYDSVLDTAIVPGDEIFFSFYLAKTAYDADGELAGPTATDPNPTSLDEFYNTAQSLWIVTELLNRDSSSLESITWHTQADDGTTYVRNFDADEGTGTWSTQSTGSPYGHNVISEDAGDYWHVGFWFKYFSKNSSGKTADLFRHTVHLSGSVQGSRFTYVRVHPITDVELFINSGVHPDAPGGLQFPTPTLAPNAPNAGSCLSIAPPFKSVEVDETGLNDDSAFEEKQKSPEFIYFTQRGNEPTMYDRMIRKHRIVAATSILDENQSPRSNKLISVNNGSLYTVSTPSEEGDSYTAIEGGDSVLSPDIAQVQWTQHQGRLYFVDGKRVVVYDPALGTIEDLESKKSGEVPEKPRLIASWRNRLVLARTIEEPHNWHMSAIGDPENWDYFPALPLVTQAVSGNNARAGLASDLINTLIPYNDDLMIMGGDHSIARMTGDPMAGGQIDIVSQTIGMAYGSSWTMIPDGSLFFVSTEGRIFAMSPNGEIQKISNKFVEDAVLEDWNDAHYRVKLIWNNKDDGLHVLFLPSAVGGAGGDSSLAMNALFWERVNNAWWRDTYAAEVTPYSAVIRDGDQPQDRTVLFGTSDGTVLNWAKQDTDSTAISDYNGNSINAWVFMDVASPTLSGAGQMRVTSVSTVMSNYTENTTLELCAADDPMSLPEAGSITGTADIGPSASGRIPLRAKGANIGVRIKATSADSVFSMERLQLTITPTGRVGWLGGHEGHGHPE